MIRTHRSERDQIVAIVPLRRADIPGASFRSSP